MANACVQTVANGTLVPIGEWRLMAPSDHPQIINFSPNRGTTTTTYLPNPHRLRIHEFMHPQLGQFAPVARGFYAAEGQARVGFDYAIDEGAAGLDVRR